MFAYVPKTRQSTSHTDLLALKEQPSVSTTPQYVEITKQHSEVIKDLETPLSFVHESSAEEEDDTVAIAVECMFDRLKTEMAQRLDDSPKYSF